MGTLTVVCSRCITSNPDCIAAVLTYLLIFLGCINRRINEKKNNIISDVASIYLSALYWINTM